MSNTNLHKSNTKLARQNQSTHLRCQAPVVTPSQCSAGAPLCPHQTRPPPLGSPPFALPWLVQLLVGVGRGRTAHHWRTTHHAERGGLCVNREPSPAAGAGGGFVAASALLGGGWGVKSLTRKCISSSFRTVKKCITYLCKSKKERITVQTCLHGEGDVVVGGETTLFNCLFRRAITQDQIFVNYLLYMESHSGGEV